MKNIKIFLSTLFLLFNNFVSQAQTTIRQPSFHLQKIFFNPELRKEFSQFIDNVLRQTSSQHFFNFIDATLLKTNYSYSDAALYKHMIDNAHKITPHLSFYHQLAALKHQKKELSRQICTLLSSSKEFKHDALKNTQLNNRVINRVINNVVEIGTPATYSSSIKNYITITGKIYAVHDKKRPTDIVQSFIVNPLKKFVAYDQFIEINEYDPIDEQAIVSNSIDLIICTIGLHHIPHKKLNAFIGSLRRILKPNGIFILRDHDVTTPSLKSMAYAAHSVFNVIMNGDSLITEATEHRNFQSLDYWINIIERQGFKVGTERLLQQGDPTYNTLIKFTKSAQTYQEKEDTIIANLHNHKYNNNYKRDALQTYLTTPEWLNVDSTQHYAQFIEHAPFYEYPYLQDIGTYWKVFAHSYQYAAQEQGKLAVLTSPYTAMNLFIGVMMSVEYGTKGLISLPIKWACSGTESKTITMLIKDPAQEIAVLDYYFNNNLDKDLDNCIDNCQCNYIDDHIDKRIKILEHYPEVSMKLIETPRYKEFLDIMIKIADTHITIVEIAGNKNIQFKVRYKNNNANSLACKINGCQKLYTWQLQAQPDYTYAALKISTEKMGAVIKYCQKHQLEILYIHDF